MKLLLLLSGSLIGLSWFFPLTKTGALLACAGFFSFLGVVRRIRSLNERGSYRTILLAGMVAHLFGFYWIFNTIRDFGHFPILGAAAVFLLFIAISSLQFPLFLFVYTTLPKALDRAHLRAPLAWISVELLAIRIFPWSPAHPLSAVPALVQGAELGGITLVSFLFIWICDLAVTAVFTRSVLAGALAICAALVIGVGGKLRMTQIEEASTRRIPVALVQGNIPLSDKHDRSLAARNILKYLELSAPFDTPGQLVVWPETVVMAWLPENVKNAAYDRRVPHLTGGASLIFGSLSFRSREQLYNSAFAVGPDGEVPLPYHKRILMPFGEFTPFGDIFPVLRTLNNTAGDFSEGDGAPLIEVPLLNPAQPDSPQRLSITPLICYEDVLPQIALEGTVHGAELLVNLTNDAWFGESLAPYQHHQIALFRAIENRRSLVRSTNTGLSAIVSPAGVTELQLPPFRESAASGSASINTVRSIYSSWPIHGGWLLIAVICSCSSIFRFLTIHRRSASSRPVKPAV